MARIIKPLTALQVKNAKPKAAAYKLFDGNGLVLNVSTAGSKLWRLRYKHDGKENSVSLGKYPEVSLEEARVKRDVIRKQLAEGRRPTSKKQKLSDSFESVARDWHNKKSGVWSADHAQRVMRRFESNVFPYVGSKKISSVTVPDLLEILRLVEGRGRIETAHRVRGDCSSVFKYAMACGLSHSDPAHVLIGALTPIRRKHFSSITDPAEVSRLLKVIWGYSGTFSVECALKFAAYVFVRPGELRAAKWADFNFKTAEWRYLVGKTGTEHIVPLATQVVSILKSLQPLTGGGKYVFISSSYTDRPISENTINGALRRLGVEKDEMTGHGFRAMARTILDEVLGFRQDIIEHQLAHAVKDPLGRAYNRTKHLPERKKMMQRWADYLDELRTL